MATKESSRHTQQAVTIQNESENQIQAEHHAGRLFFDDELKLEYDGITQTTIDRQGTRKAPAIIEVYAKKALKNYKISGFEDDIIVEQLAAGQTIIIDGEEGRITNNGADAFASVDLWKFPAITQTQTVLKFSSADAVVRIRYKPMWI